MKKLYLLLSTVLMLSAFTSPVQGQQDQTNQAFATFWAQFKTAVANNDKEAVVAMTKFPFLRGEELTRDAFIRKYNKIFDRKLQRCLAKEKPVNDYQGYLDAVKLTKKHSAPLPEPQQDRGSYSVFCGEEILLFEKIEGRYLFTGTGAND
ncbi:MAG: hypothetical protein HZB31_13485 [Nitrospirae bacterium]|nr:hypothetical protein [Nitrospirota bacterium]